MVKAICGCLNPRLILPGSGFRVQCQRGRAFGFSKLAGWDLHGNMMWMLDDLDKPNTRSDQHLARKQAIKIRNVAVSSNRSLKAEYR
jgi:hypothetical protein